MSKNVSVVFFIPGRIRIKVLSLRNNESNAYGLRSMLEEESGVISVRLNLHTDSILVCYNSELIQDNNIIKIIERTLNNETQVSPQLTFLNVFSMKEPVKLSNQEDFKIGKRLFKSVLFFGIVSFLFNHMIKQLISILIFSCPLVIYLSSRYIWHYAMEDTKQKQILIKNKSVLKRLENIEAIYIDESSLLLNHDSKNTTISDEMYKFVFGMRDIGITDIGIIAKSDAGYIRSISSYLGVDKVCNIKQINTEDKLSKDNTLFVTSNKNQFLLSEKFNGILMYLYDKDENPLLAADITIKLREIYKIIWLIEFCRYCEEMKIRCQNTAVAINYLGIFLASLGYLHPLGAFCFYGINMIWQPIFVENKVLKYEKERLCYQITNC